MKHTCEELKIQQQTAQLHYTIICEIGGQWRLQLRMNPGDFMCLETAITHCPHCGVKLGEEATVTPDTVPRSMMALIAQMQELLDGWTTPCAESPIRPEVMKFAEAMERKLKENEHKGGWKECTPEWLFTRTVYG